jgi:hypothetical protein
MDRVLYRFFECPYERLDRMGVIHRMRNDREKQCPGPSIGFDSDGLVFATAQIEQKQQVRPLLGT